jgi:hypothetical protein
MLITQWYRFGLAVDVRFFRTSSFFGTHSPLIFIIPNELAVTGEGW